MKTPHKHAEMIREWALDTSRVVEYKVSSPYIPCQGQWAPIENPSWLPDIEYRLKPEPKPDKVLFAFISESYNSNSTHRRCASDNIELTFCGETGKLKDAKVLK